MKVAAIEIMRPKQWVKSGFVFAPLIFSLQFTSLESIKTSIIAALAFIFSSASVYIFNDILDINEDKKHPVKKNRPLPSGRLKKKQALIMMIASLIASYFLSLLLPVECLVIVIIYIGLNIAYSRFLKKIAIIDVLVVAIGFILRILMGAYAIDVEVSSWIVLSTFLLALFLAFGKRRHEIRMETKGKTRESLSRYNEPMLDNMINVTCGAALMSYVIYTSEMVQKTGKHMLLYTVVFVVFGLFRYLQIIFLDLEGGEPEKILFKDKLFLANIILWLFSTVLILYL